MKRHIDITLEQDIIEWLDEHTANRSAFIERVVRSWANSEIKRWTCSACSASWNSAFEQKRCISCKKEEITATST